MAAMLRGRQMSDAELLGRLLEGSYTLDERLLDDLLAEGFPAAVAVRRAARSRWHVGAALLLGGAIALSPVRPAAASEAAPAASAATTALVAGPAASAATTVLAAEPAASAARARPTVVELALAAEAELAPAAEPELAPEAAIELRPAALGEMTLVPGTGLILPAVVVNADGSASPTQQSPGVYYVVRPGDTLSHIALAAYGNAGLWPAIYDSNLGTIANANLIFPGQSIYIPPMQFSPQGVGPSATPIATGSQYTVVSGDNLSAIAERAYGNGALWWVIYNANGQIVGANPNLIRPGQVLTIPASVPPSGVANPNRAFDSTYVVRAGDSLWSIAQSYYGNATRWVDIYRTNAGVIGGNPNTIFPGQVFSMPV
jgi:nucleoid-associated protein YgaU